MRELLDPEALVERTQTGEFLGTPPYVAPEQIQGEPATAASDNYAFAAMLYERLTGVVPYPRNSICAVLWAHVHDPVPRVMALRPDLPPPVDDVFTRALACDPRDRFPSAADIVAALATAVHPPDATPTPSPLPIAPRRRRLGRPAAAASTALVAAVGLSCLPGSRAEHTINVAAQAGTAGSRLAAYEASSYRARVPQKWIITADERPGPGGTRRSSWRTAHNSRVRLALVLVVER